MIYPCIFGGVPSTGSRDIVVTRICHLNPPLNLKMRSRLPKPTVKILKIGTPEIITIIVLQLEQLDFTVQHGVQKMQTE